MTYCWCPQLNRRLRETGEVDGSSRQARSGPSSLPSPTRRGSRRPRGFTLAEALIALAILALIGTLTYGTFSRAMTARNQAEVITEHYHQVRQAMQRMTREISMAFLSEHRDCEDPRTMTSFVAKRAGTGMRLDFTSFSHTKTKVDANESDQNELAYFIGHDPEDNNRSVLMRREQARIDEKSDEGGVEQVLAENVTDLRFEFYDAKEDTWEEEWDTTSADYRRRLPLFVRIELKVKDPMGREETFVTKTRVFLKTSIYVANGGCLRCPD